MKAFILAAGKGTRMWPLTANTPKPLLPVAGKPILQHTIDQLDGKVDEIIVLVGWQGRQLMESLKAKDTEITYAKQGEQLGTAHAISIAKDHVEDRFVCINGDVLLGKDSLTKFLEDFKKNKNSMMAIAEIEDPRGYGIIETEGDMVKDIIEKPDVPSCNDVNAGIYGFTWDIFDAIDKTKLSSRGEYEITDSLRLMMEEKKLSIHRLPDGVWFELSRPWDLLGANSVFLNAMDGFTIEGKVEEGVHMEGFVNIEKGAIVRSGSYIRGPVTIGEGADIGPNCLIRGCTTIGNNCKVGNAVEIKNSIVMDNSNVPHHNYVGDSIIGKNCNLGSGTKVANLRLDGKNIIVTHQGKRINTGLRKLGVIMGDNVKTGINSMLNVGTIIGQDTFIGPGTMADGEIAPKSMIK